jgi:hypothetical protein
MKNPPTLADHIYMLTSRGDWPWQEREHLRSALFQARRFVLDDHMSAFLCDLAMAGFFKPGREIECDYIEGRVAFPTPHCSRRVAHTRLDQLRFGARLPHAPFTWIEFDLTAFKQRSEELGHEPLELYGRTDIFPHREGWLILTRGELCQASMFLKANLEDDWVFAFPWCYAWSTSDDPVGSLFIRPKAADYWGERADEWERVLGAPLSAVAAGIPAYRTNKVEIMRSMFNQVKDPGALEKDIEIMVDWAGCIRRMWAFLSTVNDIPVLRREVKATKGFMARHSYKRFLDHHTIHLNVPKKKDLRVLARHVLAMARKRAHMVRGHWRKDWRHPPSQLCEHEWNTDGICKICLGHRLWIHEHQRGDPNLGVTMADYVVHNE